MSKELKRNKRGFIVDTIYGKKVVRNCVSNVAKMSVLEFCYYDIVHWDRYKHAFSLIREQFIEVAKNLVYCLINMACIILMPIILPLHAHNEIKRAKKVCFKEA